MFRTRRPVRRVVAAMVCAIPVSLASCYRSAPAPKNAACYGDRSVRVRNESNSSIDVYMNTSRNRVMLGTVDIGVREFRLPPVGPNESVSFNARRPGGTPVARPRQSGIWFDVVCHDPR